MAIDTILTKRELGLLDQAKEKYGTIIVHGFTEMKNVLYVWVSHIMRDASGRIIGDRPTTGLVKENKCPQCDMVEFYCNCNPHN